jgi:hypothetical protein
MLQFNKSETTNTNAVWLETVNTSSGYYDNLVMVLSQSYDRSSINFELVTYSAPNQYRNWLVIQNSGSSVPIPSGQYDAGLYTGIFDDAVWDEVDVAFDAYDEKWEDAGIFLPDTLIYSDRAYVSGSNETSITQYVSQNENGTYITYNG